MKAKGTDLAFALLLSIPHMLLGAWVVLKLYEWHVMPVWETAPTLEYGRTFGLLLLFSLLKGFRSTEEKDDYTSDVVAKIGVLLVSLLLGWLVS